MAKNTAKQKTTELVTTWPVNWINMDRAFDNFRREFEKSLSSFPTIPTSKIPTLSCDVVDEGNKYVIKAEMPGIKKDEIKLNVFDNSLEVSGQHKEEEHEKKKNYVRKERSEVSYYRVIPLPDKIITDKAQAKLTDGILTITVSKISPTKSKSNSIQVQ